MEEPFTVRLSLLDDDPERGAKFEKVLNKRGANPSKVIRGLVDAYIASDGTVPFPWKIVPKSRK